MCFTNPLIPNSFLFDNGMSMIITKLLTSQSGVSVLVQPICNLLIIPTFFTEVGNRIVEKLLVIVIRCNP